MCLSSAWRTASGVSTGRRSSRAPSITRFASRLSPISSAIEIAGTIAESTSARLGARSTSEAFTPSVPPRISGPYDGNQVTCFPASSPAYARSCPAKSIPCPPKPERMISVCIASAPRRLLSDRRMHLVVAQRIGRDHVLLDPHQRRLRRDPPVGRAAREQLDHRKPQALPLDLERLPQRLLRLADVGGVVKAPPHNVRRAVHLREDLAHLKRKTVHLD